MGIEIEDIVSKELKFALGEVIKNRLGSYGSPLSKFLDEVVSEKSSIIKQLLREAIDESMSQEVFRTEIKQAFAHQLARSLMSEFKGEIEKQANSLRQQADFRARVVLAIEKIVSEANE
jgi:hypothetical protein